MKIKYLIICIYILLIFKPLSAETLEEGVNLYRQNNFIESVKLLEVFADKGSPEAEYYLAEIFLFNGFGVKRDFSRAIELLRRSASKGFIEAQYRLGYIYENKYVDFKSHEESFEWYAPIDSSLFSKNTSDLLDLAKSNNAQAQFLLSKDKNISKEESFAWLEKSAKNNFWLAKYEKYLLQDDFSDNSSRKIASEKFYEYTSENGEANKGLTGKTGNYPLIDGGGYENNTSVVEKNNKDVFNKVIAAKTRCSNLGFKAGTEKFGNCVLELSK